MMLSKDFPLTHDITGKDKKKTRQTGRISTKGVGFYLCRRIRELCSKRVIKWWVDLL